MEKIKYVIETFEDNELIRYISDTIDLKAFAEKFEIQYPPDELGHAPAENKRQLLETGKTEFEYTLKVKVKIETVRVV